MQKPFRIFGKRSQLVLIICYVMGVTTLRRMPRTEIDESFNTELLGALGGSPKFVCLAPFHD